MCVCVCKCVHVFCIWGHTLWEVDSVFSGVHYGLVFAQSFCHFRDNSHKWNAKRFTGLTGRGVEKVRIYLFIFLKKDKQETWENIAPFVRSTTFSSECVCSWWHRGFPCHFSRWTTSSYTFVPDFIYFQNAERLWREGEGADMQYIFFTFSF